MKNAKDQKPKSVVARIAPLLYSNAGVTLCTVISLGALAMKAPQAQGD